MSAHQEPGQTFGAGAPPSCRSAYSDEVATGYGIAFACLNALAALLMLPAYPLLSLAIFAVDVLIVYGLAVHGGRRAEA